MKQHSADRLTMDLPNVSKVAWSTMRSQTPFLASGNSSKLSMLDTGNDVVKYPAKLVLPEHLETRPNRSLTLPSLTSPAKVLRSPSRRTITQALPRARAPLLYRRSPPLLTFPRNSGKTES